MDDEKLVEAVARAITREMGIPEQEWGAFTNEARAAIAVICPAVIQECVATLSELKYAATSEYRDAITDAIEHIRDLDAPRVEQEKKP